jgi:hypothetical protein
MGIDTHAINKWPIAEKIKYNPQSGKLTIDQR